jgi:RHS repeat-associated protein
MTAAVNRDALVRREYNANGTMLSETQRIRTYAGLDTATHTYRLEYGYDLNGRRTSLTHPEIFESSGSRRTVYGYDTIAGALARVSDPNGTGYTYRYDLAGRVDQRTRGSVVEAFSYDSLGRLAHRTETAGGAVKHDDQLVYKESTGRGVRKTEAYETDALGNQLSSSFWSNPLSTYYPPEADTYVRSYQPGTGRLTRSQSSSLPQFSFDSSTYDPAGNRVFTSSRRAGKAPYSLTRQWQGQTLRDEPVDAITDERATYYYGADERLRVVDRRGCLSFYPQYNRQACDQQYEPAFEKKSAFEEYRYDALGRRVLVRTRQEFACTTNCFRQLRRAIWDGDQLLYEIAALGASGTAPAVMERDTGHAPNFKTNFYPTGRVEYVHGAELDAPLAMYRAEYSDSIGGGFYVPLANWKGSYDSGYSIEYCYTRQWSTAVAPPIGEPSTGGDTGTPGNATSGTETLCPTVEWPAQHEWAAHQYRRGYGGPRNWMGSLIYGQRDFSGLHYRRNRFYDAEQGRFTQEDPIGMAGGINLYGFANGDPVSYSDPYGLRADTIPDSNLTRTEAFNHYKGGTGEEILVPFNSINTSDVSATDFQGFNNALSQARRAGRTQNVGIDTRQSYTTSGEDWPVYGRITLRLQGTLSVQCGKSCSWSFSGTTKSFDDVYDFNKSTGRGVLGEILTAFGRNTSGTPYDILIRGAKPTRASGTF